VIEADPEHRVVSSVEGSKANTIVSIVEALAEMMCCPPDQLMEKLTGHTFGIESVGSG
jgi:hypothetical protein